MRWQNLLYYLMKLISKSICMMPFTVRYNIGRVLGKLFWIIVPKKRKKMAIENITRSLQIDNEAASTIAQSSVSRFGRMFVEILSFPLLNQSNISQLVTIKGLEHLIEALSYGRGVIAVGSHSSNWELLGPAITLYGFQVTLVVQKQNNKAMNQFINEYRSMFGTHVIYKNRVRELLRILGRNEIIGLLMDQDAGSDGVYVDFFAVPASTAAGAAVLARFNNTPIVPVFITETADGTYNIIFNKTMWVEKTAYREADVFATTQQLTHFIQKHVHEFPHEWFWLHNRWKHKPGCCVTTNGENTSL